MKKVLACLVLASSLAACQSTEQSNNAVAGGLIGAGTGAVIGGVATGRASGALAGAAIGGAGGAILGAAATPVRNCRAYDAYGNPILVAC
jgi:osmotically inducible lipoprotein OsmB